MKCGHWPDTMAIRGLCTNFSSLIAGGGFDKPKNNKDTHTEVLTLPKDISTSFFRKV